MTAGTMTAPKQTNAAATSPAARLNAFLTQHSKQVALACAKHLAPERMIRMALTLCSRNAKLMDCTPASILGGIIQAGELGLELSGPLGHCFLIPRKNRHNNGKLEAVFQMGYKGYLALAHRSSQVELIAPRVVYTNDKFSVRLGTDHRIIHEPAEIPAAIQNDKLPYPDNVKAVYAILRTKGSRIADFEVMTVGQVEAHRAKFAKDSYDRDSGWRTSWSAMAMKTVLTKLLKRAPLSTEIVTASTVDENNEAGIIEMPAEMVTFDSSANDRLDDVPTDEGPADPQTIADLAHFLDRIQAATAEPEISLVLDGARQTESLSEPERLEIQDRARDRLEELKVSKKPRK